MTARDDFELVRKACSPTHEQGFLAMEAFNRLFTPRPLRELVAEGWTHAWVYDDDDKEWMMWTDKMPHATVAWSELPAVPILTPNDMGVEV